jgi:hypothetical protein
MIGDVLTPYQRDCFDSSHAFLNILGWGLWYCDFVAPVTTTTTADGTVCAGVAAFLSPAARSNTTVLPRLCSARLLLPSGRRNCLSELTLNRPAAADMVKVSLTTN